MNRLIEDILHFRSDIPPFLVHLTRKNETQTASEVLKTIFNNRILKASSNQVSDAKYGMLTSDMSENDKKKNFSAICFSETPLNEIHCLLEIVYRSINLEPYGLVFIKENLQSKGVSPVFYLNNYTNDKDEVIQHLCKSFINTNSGAKILPLFANTGVRLTNPFAQYRQTEKVNFMWEREWRYPSFYGDLTLYDSDIFVGLCPHDEIDEFETLTFTLFGKSIGFIDPKRNMKWYATKLINRRKELGMKSEVV